VGGTCSTNAEKRNAYRILVGKPKVKRPRTRWVDNIKIDPRDDGVVWTGLIWLRDQWRTLVRTVMNLWVA
jgi:hypothetical protein